MSPTRAILQAANQTRKGSKGSNSMITAWPPCWLAVTHPCEELKAYHFSETDVKADKQQQQQLAPPAWPGGKALG